MHQAREILLQGTIIYGDDFLPQSGYICIRDGIIREFGNEHVEADYEGIVCPRFVNAHVHVGDSAFKDPSFLPLSLLVGPGGLKARMLAQMPREVLVEGMRRSLQQMAATGTFAFADFREGGAEGARMLEEAVCGLPLLARVLGRPCPGQANIPESCWGLGISSTRDHDPHLLHEAVAAARMAGQAVAVHAGEAARDDIGDALALQPDFLVHMNQADDSDLRDVASSCLPVVICPRSNLMTGVGLPNVKKMVQLGIPIAVGTDNVMLNSPDIFEEMHFISKALLHDDRQVFKMCTLNGAKIVGLDQRLGSIREGKEARVIVINEKSNNMWGSMSPLSSIVRRAGPSDIVAIL
ncbi:MAG: amidohydrolase family protein [Methanotrichaceae archaeon]|nr:amidohydrolase family protein [Methanotrichaceae archaeon]